MLDPEKLLNLWLFGPQLLTEPNRNVYYLAKFDREKRYEGYIPVKLVPLQVGERLFNAGISPGTIHSKETLILSEVTPPEEKSWLCY